jgi:hypothetical protein
VAFYEDYPYAEKQGATQSALANAGAEDWRVEMIELDEASMAAKITALACYESQVVALFGEEAALPERVRAFSMSITSGNGLAERVWWPSG